MVCDFIEPYCHLVDDFLIDFCKDLNPSDFTAKEGNKSSKRLYLKDDLTNEMVDDLFDLFKNKLEIPRVKRGKKQQLEPLINQESFLIN